MYTPNDILTLARAGYTADQINAILTAGQQPAPAEDPQPVPAPAPAPAPEPVPDPAPAPAPAQDPNAALIERLDSLTQMLQARNLRNDEVSPAPALTGRQILAEIINPPNYNKGGIPK